MSASIQNIQSVISSAREEMNGVVSNFEFASNSVERMASNSIDLYSPTAMSEFKRILVTARDACDNLYTTCQALVISLDNACRPILTENHDLRLIREVYVLIKELNENSEIEHNVGTSIGNMNIADASVKYSPSVEAKSIEKHWEFLCKSNPKYDALEKEIKNEERRHKEEKRKQLEARKLAESKKMSRYEYWQKIAVEYEKLYEEKITSQINSENERYQKDLQEIKKSINDGIEEITQLQQDKKSAKLFDFERKKEIASKIKDIRLKGKELENTIPVIENNHLKKLNELQNKLGPATHDEADNYNEDIDADILEKAENNVAKPKAFREEVVDFENRRSIENWVKYKSLADDCLKVMKKMKTYTNYRVVMAVFSMEMNNAAKPLQILCDRGDIGLVKINGFTFYFKF